MYHFSFKPVLILLSQAIDVVYFVIIVFGTSGHLNRSFLTLHLLLLLQLYQQKSKFMWHVAGKRLFHALILCPQDNGSMEMGALGWQHGDGSIWIKLRYQKSWNGIVLN